MYSIEITFNHSIQPIEQNRTEQNRTEQNCYWFEIHIQRIVTKTTQNKVTIKSNQTTYACLKRMPP